MRLLGILVRLGVLYAGLVGCSTAHAAPTLAIDPAKPVAIGRWTARFQQGGLYLDYDGVPVTRGGILQLFAPGYARGYYGSGENPPVAAVETLPDGGRRYTALFRYEGEGRAFEGTQQIEVHPQDRVVYTLRARWRASDPVLMEWNPIRLWVYALIGSAYTAQTAQGAQSSGRIGFHPLPGSYPATRLAPPWTAFYLTHTAVGDIALSATGAPPVLFDGREDPYLQDDRVFWCGCPEQTLAPGQEIADTITLAVTPKISGPPTAWDSSAAPVSLPASLLPIAEARIGLPPLTDAAGHPLIVPQPKRAVFTGRSFPLRGSLPIYTRLPRTIAGRQVKAELIRLADMLRHETGVDSRMEGGDWRGHGLLVAVANELGGRAAQSRLLAKCPPQAEGYALSITPDGAAVVGHDAAGAFYGLQTLRQLLMPGVYHRAAFAGVDIVDWPSLKFRGVHIFVGRNALPFHTKLIDRIFARYKLNKMVIECEYTAWRSHPEIHVPYSMSPEDLRAEVAYARSRFIEPIPLVNSLGHSEWIFENGRHLDIAEDAGSPHAYDASNPASYRLLFDIYREALDIFHPRYFHIGHDEVTLFGRYPARSYNVKKGVTQLFVEDTNRLANWLRARGVRTMLWADMLLNSTEGASLPGIPSMEAANASSVAEAQERRSRLPNDAIICDWRYTPGSEQRNGLHILKQAGFDTLGCAWYEPENIRGWTQQALQSGALGTLQTTWAGYDSNESLLDSEYRQFTAFVLAAEYAWSGSTLHPRASTAPASTSRPQNTKTPDIRTPERPRSNTLAYAAADVFARSYRGTLAYGLSRPGWALNLDAAANMRLEPGAEGEMPWSAISPVSAQSSRSGDSRDSGIPAQPLPEIRRDPQTGIGIRMTSSGVMLRGAIPLLYPSGQASSLPASVVLSIGARARTLAFLHAVAYSAAPGTRVATYTVLYADGRSVEIPVRYGEEIRALDDSTPSNSFATSVIPWNAGDDRLALRLFQWINPRPDVAVAGLKFRADDPQAAPILFGLTGAQ